MTNSIYNYYYYTGVYTDSTPDPPETSAEYSSRPGHCGEGRLSTEASINLRHTPRDKGRRASRARAFAAPRAAGVSQLLSRPAQQSAIWLALRASRRNSGPALALCSYNCALLQLFSSLPKPAHREKRHARPPPPQVTAAARRGLPTTILRPSVYNL